MFTIKKTAMKTTMFHTTKALALFTILFLTCFTSCKKEDETISPEIESTPLTVENLSASIAENPEQDQVIETIVATGDNLTFTIKSQSVSSALQIEESTGAISVLTPSVFDYEMQTSLTAEVNVTDGEETIVATITISITDVDETPIHTPLTAQDLDVTIAENPEQGDVIGRIQATGNNLNFSFVNSKQNLIYELNEVTGEVSVLSSLHFDYEISVRMVLNLNVTDGIDTLEVTLTTSLTNVLEVGELHEGGIIFWINPDDSTEGLVCALDDQSTEAPWGCEGTEISGADSKALGDGNRNTIEIEAGCNTVGTAADLCANLTSNNYSDWFLPTENELSEIYSNIVVINDALTENQGTAFVRADGGAPFYNGAYYWSSSEHIAQSAIPYDFSRGEGGIDVKGSLYHVRAIRSF